MAIGKLNAYATVDYSNVDFGKIAVDAQEALSSKLESKRAAMVKKKELETEQLETDITITGNKTYDERVAETIKNATDNIYSINVSAKARGSYTEKEKLMIANYKNLAKTLSTSSKNTYNMMNEYSKNIDKYDDLDKGRQSVIDAISSKENVYMFDDGLGNTIYRIAETDSDNNKIIGSDGNVVFRKINIKGVKKDFLTQEEVSSGALFNGGILKIDHTEALKKIQGTIVTDSKKVDPNGITSISEEKLTPKKRESARKMIKQYFTGNYDNLATFLHGMDSEKYKEPKKMSEYIADGDLDVAVDEFEKQVYTGINFSWKQETRTPSGGGSGKDNDKDKDIPTIMNTTTSGTDGSLNIPVKFGDKLKPRGIDGQVRSIGYDPKSKTFFITYMAPESKSGTVGGKGEVDDESGTIRFTSPKRIYFNGPKAEAASFHDVAARINKPGGGRFEDGTELIRYIYGVYKGKVVKSKKSTGAMAEWNKKAKGNTSKN